MKLIRRLPDGAERPVYSDSPAGVFAEVDQGEMLTIAQDGWPVITVENDGLWALLKIGGKTLRVRVDADNRAQVMAQTDERPDHM